ncbi:MAG: helical backbone metal receptor [Candidatus Hinthialibacter antarcticus]|nr:helical backbone metal receptor [Candidatus Hinthialibacter antarcticus]
MNRSVVAFIVLLIIGAVLSFSLQYYQSNHTSRKASPGGAFPSRIICAAPSAVEIVFALDCGDRVVGVSDFVAYPPEAVDKPLIGGYFNPNYERILSMKADLLILQGESEKLTLFCKDNQIQLLRIDMTDIETILNDVRRVGKTLGVNENAAALIQTMQERLDNVKKQASEIQPKPNVFISLGRKSSALSNITTCGGGTFLSELLTLAGGENTFGDLGDEYPQISLEAITKREPEVILDFQLENTRDAAKAALDWQSASLLPAVENQRVYAVTESFFLIPGPRMPQAAERLVELIHG